jgi:hypothetical protein
MADPFMFFDSLCVPFVTGRYGLLGLSSFADLVAANHDRVSSAKPRSDIFHNGLRAMSHRLGKYSS